MSRPYRKCSACPTRTQNSDLCTACHAAKKDAESPWDLGEGYWRQRRGTKEWVPLLPVEDEAELLREERTCRGCPIVFRPRHNLQRYHDTKCRERADYRRRSQANPHPVEVKAMAREKPLPKTNTLRQFTDDECRDGRARYVQGDRSPLTLAQSREYGRVMKAARRRELAESSQKQEVA